MIRVAFDTNVLLDAIANRQDYEIAQELIMMVAMEEISGVITANSITDVYYIARKCLSDEELRNAIRNLLTVFDIVPVDGEICSTALNLPMRDFEDAVLAVCADCADAQYIVTRDEGLISEDNSPVQALRPSDILNIISGALS